MDVDSDIAFSSGMHAGELEKVRAGVGGEWARRFVARPMVVVEAVATMPAAQLGWYRRLQETAWALVGEAFSERVVVPGVTSTEVGAVLGLGGVCWRGCFGLIRRAVGRGMVASPEISGIELLDLVSSRC